MKSFLFKLGFDPSHVMSVLAAEGMKDGDQIILIAPTISEKRQRNAVEEVERFASSLDIDVSIRVVDGLGDSFSERIEGLKKLFSDLENIVLSLSGGTRDCLIPLTIAATLTGEDIDKTYFRSDIDSELEKVEFPSLPVNISKAQKQLLNRLNENKLTVKELATKLDKSESTVYEQLSVLTGKNLVRSTGSPKKYSITFSGKLCL